MSTIEPYDAAASLAAAIGRIHSNWREQYEESTSGQKAWFTQMKNHYLRIAKSDPLAAAQLLAMHEHLFSLLRKHGLPEQAVADAIADRKPLSKIKLTKRRPKPCPPANGPGLSALPG